ncbi:MAG: hypothetical protein HOB37_02805 [Rhodospirillaceae bacterium]|nr:hypothetical protein [Rhodospirillaceae bacterium]
MKRAVLVICDGLRADMVRPQWTPHLCRLGARSRIFNRHRGVFPSTTRTTSASIATGCLPARHGLEGNAVALDEGNGLIPLSVGAPDFRDRLRAATGKTLREPTLAERLVDHGGSIVFSNVSPGAAFFQDPDGYGYVYHRAGSFGPGLAPIDGSESLKATHGAAGDTAMTERFCDEVLRQRKPALAVLWQCEPDHSQHAFPLGSPAHLDAMAAADRNAQSVADTVDALNADGEDILLIMASDHGHQTVDGIVDLDALLMEAGFKAGPDSTDCVVTSQGFSAFIYLDADHRGRADEIATWLESVDGVGNVHVGNGLTAVGQRPGGALAIAVNAENSDAKNAYGIPGLSTAFANRFSMTLKDGHGDHGGLGRYEQSPFLIVRDGGFAAGSMCDVESSAVDIAPTVLAHFDLPTGGMDGRPLERE